VDKGNKDRRTSADRRNSFNMQREPLTPEELREKMSEFSLGDNDTDRLTHSSSTEEDNNPDVSMHSSSADSKGSTKSVSFNLQNNKISEYDRYLEDHNEILQRQQDSSYDERIKKGYVDEDVREFEKKSSKKGDIFDRMVDTRIKSVEAESESYLDEAVDALKFATPNTRDVTKVPRRGKQIANTKNTGRGRGGSSSDSK